jgi:NadR type nicotinamide-nucleotide adenylyltransferase
VAALGQRCFGAGGGVSSRLRKVVLIGPESTGKTWLAGELAAHYGVPWAEEHAREYVLRHGQGLTRADVDPIGRGQRQAEDDAVQRAERAAAGLVILDTDLVSTMVYSRHYYGDCPPWIEEEARRRRGDLYLLHHVDVPWVEDGQQREQPERREELFALFRSTLRDLGLPVAEVAGSWEERRLGAEAAIDRLLAEPVSRQA